MTFRMLASVLFIALLSMTATAEAAINCTISSPGYSVFYSGSLAVTQSSFTIECTRLSTDPSTSTYSVRPDNGQYASGQQNRARLGETTLYLQYESYQDSGCGTLWRPVGGGDISGTVNFGTSLTASVTRNYWGCVPANQTYAAGNYTDTVTMTLQYHNGTGNVNTTNTHPVSIITQASCSISTPPGTVAFTYTAFQQAAATATTSFGVTCTNTLPYTMSASPTIGVVSGLNYSLGINTTNSGGSASLGSTGTGVQQTFHINGTMSANQAGTCTTGSCVGTQVRTLTVTF